MKEVVQKAMSWPRWVPRQLRPRHLRAARLLALGMRPGEEVKTETLLRSLRFYPINWEIAELAGESAEAGVAPFLSFLVMISLSLGFLNLLPIPILDGGLLLYYAVEVVKGSPLSVRSVEVAQRIGVGVLILLTALALYNDLTRLLS
jgi:Zn-dependent protease